MSIQLQLYNRIYSTCYDQLTILFVLLLLSDFLRKTCAKEKNKIKFQRIISKVLITIISHHGSHCSRDLYEGVDFCIDHLYFLATHYSLFGVSKHE